MKTPTNSIMRNGLGILIGNRKIVEISYTDMDTAGGKIVLNDGKAYPNPRYGEDITVWLPNCEVADEIEAITKKEGFCEVVVFKPFEQPDGRKFAQLNYVLGSA
jgi:hypothetical protein